MPTPVGEATFAAEVLDAALPVLLDVWSPGCGPCKQLEPVMIELATRYDGRVKVCELNAAAAPGTSVRLGVRATPTVIYFRGGEEVERIVGFRSSLYHQQSIEELFGLPPA
jgi:thioredoxin 1